MKKIKFLLPGLFISLFILTACNPADVCTGEYAKGCGYELLNEFPLPEDNAMFCSCQADGEISEYGFERKSGNFDYYMVSDYEGIKEILDAWDSYLTGKGYVHIDGRMPANYVAQLGANSPEDYFKETEIERLVEEDNLQGVYRFYAKGDELILFDLGYRGYQKLVEVSVQNSPTPVLLPENYEEILDSVKSVYTKYSQIKENGGSVERPGFAPDLSDTLDILYLHTSGSAIDTLMQEKVGKRKFSFQKMNFYSIFGAEPGTLNSLSLEILQQQFLHSDYIVIFDRTGLKQPVATGQSSTSYNSYDGSSMTTDYYIEGWEKGKIYVLDGQTLEIVKIEDYKRNSLYDFKEEPFDQNSTWIPSIRTKVVEVMGTDAINFYPYETMGF